MKLLVRNIKVLPNTKQDGFQASLYIGRKRHGTIINFGNGDITKFQFPLGIEIELEQYLNLCKVSEECKNEDQRIFTEEHILELVEIQKVKEWVQRNTRNQILYRLKGDPKDKFRREHGRNKEELVERFKGQIEEIL